MAAAAATATAAAASAAASAAGAAAVVAADVDDDRQVQHGLFCLLAFLLVYHVNKGAGFISQMKSL